MNRLEEVMKLRDRELDYAIGKEIMEYTIYHYDKDYEENCYFMLMDADFDALETLDGRRKTEEKAWDDCPYFSVDFSKAWEALKKVESRSLTQKMQIQTALKDISGINEWSELFPSLTPELVCKAALYVHRENEPTPE